MSRMARTAPVPNMVAIPGMNPGLFVLGGGGDGGGSGAGAGKGKNGKQGANGKNGGKDASGGGKNAGACGAGSGGGCPNPQHGGGGGTAAGHPIDPVTGRVYTLAAADMVLPGAFPLVIERAYSSAQADVDSGLGYGWNHSLGWRIIEGRRRVRIMTENALACEGPRPEPGGSVKLPVGVLTKTAGGYALLADDGLTRLFDEAVVVDGEYRLSALVDRNGNQARLFYQDDKGPLLHVDDSVGRRLRVRRNREGRIAAFEVKNASSGGAWTSFRTYEYDQRGDLVGARDALGHAVTFEYDEDHRLLQERWPTGLTVRYRYDDHGRCTETWCNDPGERALIAEGVPDVLADGSPAKGFLHAKVEYGEGENNVITSRALRRVGGNALGKADRVIWAGQVHDNEFDAAGELAGYRDALGRAWKMGREGGSYRVMNPLGQVTEYEHDERGNVVATRLHDGSEARHARDARGNLVALSDGLGLVASFRHDDRGCLVYAETSTGAGTTIRYDALCNRVEIVEPDGGARKLRHDFLGRLVEMVDEKGGVHRWTHDAMGRVVEHVSPLGARTSYHHDEAGRLVEQRDPDGRWFRLVYAGLREVIAVERSDGTRVTYGYDRELDLVRVVNEEGDVHRIERDIEGRILSERTFDGRTLLYKNDAAGRLSKITFDDGESVDLAYDDLDRLVRRTFSDGSFHHIEYDDVGRVALVETEAVRTRYTYDARGRCTREDTELAGDPASATSVLYFHDAGMCRVRTSLLGSWSIGAARDAAGRCTALTFSDARGAEQPLATFAYDPTWGETARLFAGGGGIENTRDAHGRVIRTSVFGAGAAGARPGEPLWVGRRGGPETLRLDYQWSPAGELQALRDRDRGAQALSYDARGRVTQRRFEQRAGTEEYDLSPRGDVRSIHGRPQVHAAGGRLVTAGGSILEYDARGRLVRKVEGGAETRFEWNVLGLLTRVTLPDGARVELVYDAFARRLEKRVVRREEEVRHRYRWDADDLVEETVERRPRDGGGPAELTLVERRRYAYAPHSPVPVAQAIDTPAGDGPWQYFVHRDGAAVPLALTGADGSIQDVFDSEPYGRVLSGDPTATLSRFPGHWYDPETRLHYNRWRYFDPTTATYLSPEPIGLAGGLEGYAYVGGRPLVLIDRDGLARSVTTLRDRNGAPIGTGTSGQVSGPGDLHPAVAAALPIDSARGGDTAAHSCSEPHALSQHLRNWEAANPGQSCDPGTPQGRQNLNRALSQIGGISSQAGTKPLAACPNCSQTISRLWAMADPPLPPPPVAGGQTSVRDRTPVPGGYQNPEGPRVVNPANGTGPITLPASPLAQNINNPANARANEAAYRAAGGTGDVSGLNPGVFDNSSGTWGARP